MIVECFRLVSNLGVDSLVQTVWIWQYHSNCIFNQQETISDTAGMLNPCPGDRKELIESFSDWMLFYDWFVWGCQGMFVELHKCIEYLSPLLPGFLNAAADRH